MKEHGPNMQSRPTDRSIPARVPFRRSFLGWPAATRLVLVIGLMVFVWLLVWWAVSLP